MSHYNMIDVSEKINSKRVAIASGKIYVGKQVINLIKTNQMLKGDPIRLAEIAAIMGAKKTSHLIPLCHPLGLDKVEFMHELLFDESAIKVYCIAITSAKTGVEMEALTGVMTGLLTIYDLSKISEPSLTIGDVQLLVKIGGKSGVWFNPQVNNFPDWVHQYIPKETNLSGITCATLTLSDRVFQGVYADHSGELLQQLLIKYGAAHLEHIVLADDPNALTYEIQELIKKHQLDLIIMTGGTGVSPRDITPETILALGGREIPGIGELLRIYGSQFTQFSWGSRSLGLILDHTLVIALPGSRNAINEGVACLGPILPHLIRMTKGDGHD